MTLRHNVMVPDRIPLGRAYFLPVDWPRQLRGLFCGQAREETGHFR